MLVNGINTPKHQYVSYYKVDPNIIILNPNNDDILCGPWNSRENCEHPGNIALQNYIEAKKASCNYTHQVHMPIPCFRFCSEWISEGR